LPRLKGQLKQSELRDMSASLNSGCLRLFSLATMREARFLAAKMRTGFQFIVLTGVAVKEKDLLGVFSFRHKRSFRKAIAKKRA
jgi:hypothetical protein